MKQQQKKSNNLNSIKIQFHFFWSRHVSFSKILIVINVITFGRNILQNVLIHLINYTSKIEY